MKITKIVPVIAILLFCLEHGAYATEGDQECDPSMVRMIGKRVGLPDFSLPENGMYSSSTAPGRIVAGVCKVVPTNDSRTIAAFAYDAGVQYEKTLIVALVDTQKGKVLALHKGVIPEDGATEVNSGSLGIDTARYVLSTDTTAFGVRVNSFRDRCGYEGGFDDELTLFVVEGKTIRPVLNQTMHHWTYVGGARCGGEEVQQRDAYLSVAVEPTASHGFADLRITAKRGDGKGKISAKVHYDGEKYRLESWEKKYSEWTWHD
jgi:hypothetical protein